jgi:MscS family membrane protein
MAMMRRCVAFGVSCVVCLLPLALMAQGVEGAPADPLPPWQVFFAELLSWKMGSIPLWRMLAAFGLLVFGIFTRNYLLERLLKPIASLTSRTKTDIDDKMIEYLRHPGGWLINIMAFYAAVMVLQLPAGMQAALTLILRTAGTIVIAWVIYNGIEVIATALEHFAQRTESEIDDNLVPLVRKLMRVVLVVVALIMIIQQWGYDVTSLVAGLGIGGLAFALAAQPTLSNLFGSITILTDRPFKLGDWVKTSSGEGEVEEIGLRSTKIRTMARTLITVPNAEIAAEAVENFSARPNRRITCTVGVTYSTTRAQLVELLADIRAMLAAREDIEPDTFRVHFNNFGPSSLDILVHAYALTRQWADWLVIQESVYLEIMRLVEAHGASFAFPSQSLYIETPIPQASPPEGKED